MTELPHTLPDRSVEEAVALLTKHPERLQLLLDHVSTECEYPFCKRRVLPWEEIPAADGSGAVYCMELHRVADAALLNAGRVAAPGREVTFDGRVYDSSSVEFYAACQDPGRGY